MKIAIISASHVSSSVLQSQAMAMLKDWPSLFYAELLRGTYEAVVLGLESGQELSHEEIVVERLPIHCQHEGPFDSMEQETTKSYREFLLYKKGADQEKVDWLHREAGKITDEWFDYL